MAANSTSPFAFTRTPPPASPPVASGFTLIELVMVILVLSIVSAAAIPRFTGLSVDSRVAVVERAGAAFDVGVRLAHVRWVLNGPAAGNDDVAGFGDGTVDVHDGGYPADTEGGNSVPNNATGVARCARVWSAIMDGAPTVGPAEAEGFTASTVTGNVCRFTSNADANLSITYRVNTGEVTIDADPSS